MNLPRHLLCTALLAAPLAALAGPTVPLAPGGSVNLSVPASSFTNDVYIDVPEGAQRLTVSLNAVNPANDVDLLVRFDSPFPDATIDGLAPEAEWLFEHAQYLSANASGAEKLVLTPNGRYPLRAGRLYISVLNFASSATPAVLSATLGGEEVVPIAVRFDDRGSGNSTCDISGWSDASARTPVRGNNGTTLGQQRRNAMLEAARLLTEQVRPTVPIVIRACWGNLPFSNTGGTLAQASPRAFYVSDVLSYANGALQSNLRFLDEPYVIYSQAAAAQQAGTQYCGFGGGTCAHDVNIEFNLAVDNASQTNRRFDYGFEQVGGTGSSFVTTALHEITHGLGFLGLINLNADNGEIGARLSDYDDIYGKQVVITLAGEPAVPFLETSNAARAAALTASSRVRFTGPNAIASPQNTFAAFVPPDRYVRLHTPGELAGGSTYSHLAGVHINQLMNASISSSAPRNLGLAGDMLKDLGWKREPREASPVPLPADGQYFDPAHNGHGFDFRRVAGTEDIYFLVYYSFDDNGNPEWYSSTGRTVDGIFLPARNQHGDSLLRNLFRPGQTPQTVADADPAFNGQVRVDFVGAKNAPSCRVGRESRPNDDSQGVLTWRIGNGDEAWCMQPLTAGGAAVDYSGIWFDPADPGWGITFVSYPTGNGDGLAAQIYYPDASGRGRWAVMYANDYTPGGTYPVYQISNGYCRTCPAPAEQQRQEIGSITVSLVPGGAGSTVSMTITYPGAEGGTFARSNAPIVPGSEPVF